jgi:hypothetical protein
MSSHSDQDHAQNVQDRQGEDVEQLGNSGEEAPGDPGASGHEELAAVSQDVSSYYY